MFTRPLILLAAASGLLRADVVTYTVSPAAGGFSYQFTLSNTGTTGDTLFDLFLSLPTEIANIDTNTIGTPMGWGDAIGGLLFFGPDVSPLTSFIEWVADFSGAHDVAIGSSRSGFSFTSADPVGMPISFALNGSTTLSPAEQITTVPEPVTLALLAAASLLLPLARRIHCGSGPLADLELRKLCSLNAASLLRAPSEATQRAHRHSLIGRRFRAVPTQMPTQLTANGPKLGVSAETLLLKRKR